MVTNIFAFAVVIGVLIFFHELGHFLVARLFGVGVEKFSLGFGPRLIGKKIGITDYRISAVPLGGYVKMVGEEPDADLDPADIPLSFTHKHPLKKILIVAAGPVFNVLLAVIIFYGIFQVYGTYIMKPAVGKVEQNSPADRAGLQKGDLVIAIGGKRISSWEEMAEIISKSDGSTITLSILRDDANRVFQVTPRRMTTQNIFGENIERYVIGVTASGDLVEKGLNPFQAFSESIVQTYNISKLIVVSVVKLIQGKLSTKTLGGPIMIAALAGQQAKAGISNLLFFIALISINLAILNLLPIPVLDGGHLVFFTIEAIIGKPVNIRTREILQMIGIFLLVSLMIYVIYNDIMRYLGKVKDFF